MDTEKGDDNKVFMYGMKNRRLIEYLPLERLIRCDSDKYGKYCFILIYAMPLNEHEQETYDLDYLGECKIRKENRWMI